MMDHSDEWKSLWPISSVHSPPLLLPQTAIHNHIGPLKFHPQTHHHIFTLPSAPFQTLPYPTLTPTRFLHKASSILPSTITSFSPQLSSFASYPEQFLAHNCLQLLRCPGTDSVLAFFPTGSNLDQVGFVALSVDDSRLTVNGGFGETGVLSLKNGLAHRIVEISVSPLADCQYTSGGFSDCIIGCLLVSTTHSVHYHKIRIRTEHSGKITPALELVDHKTFKSSMVVHACWSPHIPEESLVLLDSGDLFLYDLDSFSGPAAPSQRLTGKKIKVSWEEHLDIEKGGCWLCCDFSWHPRILVVVHSTGVFLVDSRSENYDITPMFKLGTEHATNDRFLAFSIVGPDRFYFTLASEHMLYLCDIRKPMMPVIRWAHNVANPSYIFVSSLSELRSLSEDVTYSWASEAGYGILLGSFWNCEFSLFCYGPPRPYSCSIYAWGLPSDISLATRECRCGSCLVKEDFSKDQLPVWINWQQKKDFVLGFGFLDEEISSQLFEPDSFGGFTVITLTASGNIELHRHRALWDYSLASEKCHIDGSFDFEDSVLYETGEEGFKFKKVFQYLKLDWLDGYLNSDLNRILSINLYTKSDNDIPRNASFGPDFHEYICKSLKEYSSDGSIQMNDVFKDVYSPTSVHEIALRSVWSNLPKKVLRLGFSTYSDLPNVPAKLKNLPFEFLEVPCQQSEQPSLPPFFFRVPSSRSSKWSEKHKPSDHLVGPVTPIPFLMAYHKTLILKADNRPADSEIDLECDKVMRVANEVIGSESQSGNNHTVSLADDNEDAVYSSQNLQHFSSYKTRTTLDGSGFEDEKYRNILFRVGQKDEKGFFDSSCLLKFKTNEQNTSFGEKEKKWYKIYKRQYSNFKQSFDLYQKYLTESNITSQE